MVGAPLGVDRRIVASAAGDAEVAPRARSAIVGQFRADSYPAGDMRTGDVLVMISPFRASGSQRR